MTFVDSHQHYWSLGHGHNNWPRADLPAIFRDFGPADLMPHLETTGVTRTVLVQAAPNLAETEFLLDLAATQDNVAAVVGWVDLASPDVVTVLEALLAHPKFRGIRPMLQGIEDTHAILRSETIAVLERLAPLGLRFDALIQPRHVPAIACLADRLPDLQIVVDHAAKPFIAQGRLEPWRSDMAALAQRQNVSVKLSGLVTEAGESWTIESLRPYSDHLIACFGPDRMMFGSDWPVVELASTYERWFETATQLTRHLPFKDRHAIFCGTATRFYGL